MIRVLLVDDQTLMRAGIRDILAADGRFWIEEAASGVDALAHLEQHEIDVVLMDIRMPGWDGVHTTERITARFGASRPRILILTTFEYDENVIDAVHAGADGFLGKGIEPQELVEAICSLAAGGAPLSSRAGEALVKHVGLTRSRPWGTDATVVARFSALTPRERAIVSAIARGLTAEEIAAAEHISPYTVKTHITRAMNKVGAADRTQLVALAFQAGLMSDS